MSNLFVFKGPQGGDPNKYRLLRAGPGISIAQSGRSFAISADGADNSMENVGSSGVGVFKQKSGASFQLRKIAAGAGIVVTQTGDTITISLE